MTLRLFISSVQKEFAPERAALLLCRPDSERLGFHFPKALHAGAGGSSEKGLVKSPATTPVETPVETLVKTPVRIIGLLRAKPRYAAGQVAGQVTGQIVVRPEFKGKAQKTRITGEVALPVTPPVTGRAARSRENKTPMDIGFVDPKTMKHTA